MRLNDHWYVLLTVRSKEDEVCQFLNENEGIHVFCPKMEFYHRVKKEICLRPLFAGYVFVISPYSQKEVDAIFRKFPLTSVFIHELKYNEEISALKEEEIKILTYLLDEENIVRMSYGDIIGKRLHITKGPIYNMDDYIIKYDKHEHTATLDLDFLNQKWKVGVCTNSDLL